MVRLLLNNGANSNTADKNGGTALEWAVRENRLQTVYTLLSHGAEVNTRNNTMTPLQWACLYGYQNIIKALMQHGAEIMGDINPRWESHLFRIQRRGHSAIHSVLDEQNVCNDVERLITTFLWGQESTRKAYQETRALIVEEATRR